jgi:hypothetical protein
MEYQKPVQVSNPQEKPKILTYKELKNQILNPEVPDALNLE